MASRDDWERSEKFEILEDALFEGVAQGDFTERELHDAIVEIGPPETWDNASILVDNGFELLFAVYKTDEQGETKVHHFTVGSGEENMDPIYEFLDDEGVDFDVVSISE